MNKKAPLLGVQKKKMALRLLSDRLEELPAKIHYNGENMVEILQEQPTFGCLPGFGNHSQTLKTIIFLKLLCGPYMSVIYRRLSRSQQLGGGG